MSSIKIGGVELPSPLKFKFSKFDLDSPDTNRNEEGVLQRDRVRSDIFKIELEWRMVTNDEANIIEDSIKPAKVDVTFITSKGFQTKVMYVGDRKVDIAFFDGDINTMLWNISFNLTEY